MTELHSTGPRNPGILTAAMGVATQATRPSVLRVARVEHGRIVDERLIKHQGEVTLGSSEDCTFLVEPGAGRLQLFTFESGSYHLTISEAMEGSVDLTGGPKELSSLKLPSGRKADGTWRVRVPIGSKGRLVVGTSILLFQFVEQPRQRARAQLPASVRMQSQIDWRFTVIASFSFVLHFGAIGMLYTDWADTTIDEVATITGVIEAVAALPPAPPPDDRVHGAESSAEVTAAKDEKPGGIATAERGQPNRVEGTRGPKSSGITDRERASMLEELRQIDMGVVGVVNGTGPATQNVLRSGDNATGALEQIGRESSGARDGNCIGLNLGNGNGAVSPTARNDFPGLPVPGPATPVTTGSASSIKPPAPVATVQATPQTTGAIRNLEATVAGLRPGFRQCYVKYGLEVNPEMQGSVRVTAVIGSNGEVQSAVGAPAGTISGTVAACIAGKVRGARFDPPEAGMATVIIPVQLRHQ